MITVQPLLCDLLLSTESITMFKKILLLALHSARGLVLPPPSLCCTYVLRTQLSLFVSLLMGDQ